MATELKKQWFRNLPDANLVSYWRFEGNSNDDKGSNNGTDTSITYSTGNGLFGQGAGFNGSSSFVALPALGSFTTFSISFWLKTTQSTAGQNFFMCNTAGNACFNTNLNDVAGKFGIFIWNGSTTTKINSATTVNDGNWHHIVFTRNGANGIIYVDGRADASSSALHTITIVSDTNKTFFGKHESGVQFYNGAQDDFALFNRVLTPAEVDQIYQTRTFGEYLGAGSAITKGLWHLNGNSNDSSGNGITLTNNNSVTIGTTNGMLGGGADFGSTNTNKYLSNASALAWNTLNSGLTISLWVNFYNFTSTHDLFGFQDTSWSGVFCRINSATSITFRFGNGITSDGGSTTVTVPTMTAGNWYNIIMTHNSGANDYYLNGVLIGTRSTNVTLSGGGSGLAIGQTYGAGVNFSSVKIDEFITDAQFWSASQVKKYYTYAKGRFGIN